MPEIKKNTVPSSSQLKVTKRGRFLGSRRFRISKVLLFLSVILILSLYYLIANRILQFYLWSVFPRVHLNPPFSIGFKIYLYIRPAAFRCHSLGEEENILKELTACTRLYWPHVINHSAIPISCW